MRPNATPDRVEPEGVTDESSEPAARAMRVALALYLSPVVAIVCVIGLASIALMKIARTVQRLSALRPDRSRVENRPASLVGSVGLKPLPPRDRRKIRV